MTTKIHQQKSSVHPQSLSHNPTIPYIIIIPARLKSSRLPNKMLLPLQNKPLIEWTWRKAMTSQASRVIIATDSEKIATHMTTQGAEVILTASHHPSGTDRLSEVALKEKLADDEIVVNWQGDEPFLPIELIDKVANAFIEAPLASISTIGVPLKSWQELTNPNIVKIVINQQNEALYFSRAPIPYPREKGELLTTLERKEGSIPSPSPYLRHLGVYAYRGAFLKAYPTLASSPLETYEKLEQLRALYNGHKIQVEISSMMPPPGIDTQEDLQIAQAWLQSQV